MHSFDKAGKNIVSVNILKNSPHCISAAKDGSIRLWDLENYKLIDLYHPQKTNYLHDIAIYENKENTRLLTAGADKHIEIHSLTTKERLLKLKKTDSLITEIHISKNKNFIFYICKNGNAWVLPIMDWNKTPKELINQYVEKGTMILEKHFNNPTRLQYIQDTQNKKLLAWEKQKIDQKNNILANAQKNIDNGNYTIARSWLYQIIKKERNDKWKKIFTQCDKGDFSTIDEKITKASLSNNNTCIIAKKNKDTLTLIDTITGNNIRSLSIKEYNNKIVSSKNGRYLLRYHFKSASLWDTKNNKNILKKSFKKHIHDIAISPDGNFYIIRAENKLRLWNTQKETNVQMFLPKNGGYNMFFTFSPNSKTILFSEEEMLYIWDIENKKNIQTIYHKNKDVTCIKLTKNHIIIGSNNGITIWSRKDINENWDVPKTISAATSIAVKENMVVYGNKKGNIIVYDIKTKKVISSHSIPGEVIDINIAPNNDITIIGTKSIIKRITTQTTKIQINYLDLENESDFINKKCKENLIRQSAVTILPQDTDFSDSGSIYLKTVNNNLNIHYTLDGSPVTQTSPKYTKGIPINKSTFIKAKAYSQDGKTGHESYKYYNKSAPISTTKE